MRSSVPASTPPLPPQIDRDDATGIEHGVPAARNAAAESKIAQILMRTGEESPTHPMAQTHVWLRPHHRRNDRRTQRPRCSASGPSDPVRPQSKTHQGRLAVIKAVFEQQDELGDVLADREYTKRIDGSDFILPIRALGGEPVFDLTKAQLGARGTTHGAIMIDGHPHSPATPASLHHIPAPPVNADLNVLRDYQDKIARRAKYALESNGSRLSNGAVDYQCPATAGKLSCPLQPTSPLDAFPVTTAPSAAAKGSVCAGKYKRFHPEDAPCRNESCSAPPMAPIVQPPKPSRRLLRQPPQRSLRKPQTRHHPSPRTHQDRHSRHGRRRRRQPSPRSKLCPTANHPGQTEARPPQTRRHRRLRRHLPPRRRSQRPTRRLTRTPK